MEEDAKFRKLVSDIKSDCPHLYSRSDRMSKHKKPLIKIFLRLLTLTYKKDLGMLTSLFIIEYF